MSDLYTKIYSDLFRHQDKDAARLNARYHKYEGHKTFGINAPTLSKLLKKYRSSLKDLSQKEILSLALKLYKTKLEEGILAANFILQFRNDCIGPGELPFFDKALEYFCSWSTIDDFCIDVLQPVLMASPRETLKFLEKWNRSKNMWKRRVSVVAFVRRAGKTGKFTVHALRLCDRLIWDKEDLVQKGVGWCLKDIMRGDKVQVIGYVKRLRAKGVPSKITLYAIRDLKGNDRRSVLNA